MMRHIVLCAILVIAAIVPLGILRVAASTQSVGNTSPCVAATAESCGNGESAGSAGNGLGCGEQGNGHNGEEKLTLAGCTKPGTHVPSVVYGWGYNGVSTNVTVATQAQWVTYAYQGSYQSQYDAAGIKTIGYKNFWGCYPSDNPVTCYGELAPVATCQSNAATYGYSTSICTGTYASQEAKNCSGTAIVDSHYGGGYVNAPYISTTNFAQIASDQSGTVSEDYIFSDDTEVNFNGSPCNYNSTWNASQWVTQSIAAMNAATAKTGKAMFANAINGESGATAVQNAGIAQATNVVGVMCENCYVSGGGTSPAYDTGTSWVNHQDACLTVQSYSKMCWMYANIGAVTNASDAAMRLYSYASFLLTYTANESMYEVSITGLTDTMPVMPEEELVPVNPRQSATGNDITTLGSSGGYYRSWTDCFYDGVDKGACAVAVNPNTSGNMTVSTTGFSHAMVIPTGTATSDIVGGGAVSLTGTSSSTVGPESAEILFP